MSRYQVSIIERPATWEPAAPDDVPAQPGKPLEILAETDDLFAAVRQAVQYNQQPPPGNRQRWAVVVEPGTVGRTWPNARLCTPLRYQVTSLWWPNGWEPHSPLDVPNCIWKSQGEADCSHCPARSFHCAQEEMTLEQTLRTTQSRPFLSEA